MASRIIGIDFGLRRIGLALSDESKILATPLETYLIENKMEKSVANLMSHLLEHSKSHYYTIEMIVVGMPYMMNGSHGHLADEVDHFVTLLKNHTEIPIVTWDERLSSVQADRSLREANLSRKKRKQHVDKVAATLILQSYLDSRC
ncbi:MAG: Holliday junction resolvase RuvX [Waddliaceae bacterium]